MEKAKKPSETTKNNVIWDCESSLYDSFELKAFNQQLDSAISSRSLSMPHLSERRLPPPPHPSSNKKTTSSKLSRSLQRFIRSIFKPKSNNVTTNAKFGHQQEGFYVVYDKSGALTTIPEAPEFDGLSPELRSLVRRTASDRFTAATSNIGISCA